MNNFNELREQLLTLNARLENGDYDAADKLYEFEEELHHHYDETDQEYQVLKKGIKAIKLQHDLYDEETELDRMFPDRHDEDFDEDSMSWESVFGDD